MPLKSTKKHRASLSLGSAIILLFFILLLLYYSVYLLLLSIANSGICLLHFAVFQKVPDRLLRLSFWLFSAIVLRTSISIFLVLVCCLCYFVPLDSRVLSFSSFVRLFLSVFRLLPFCLLPLSSLLLPPVQEALPLRTSALLTLSR
jgi:hypothetical protein